MGSKGTLPWKIKEDWEYFLKTTEGGVLLMGEGVMKILQNIAHPPIGGSFP